MATLTDSLVSSSARPLRLRRRPDLSSRRHRYQGRDYWVVKEPIGLNYFRFQEEEFAILQMLDGHTSLDEIKRRFEAEFPPQKITLEELQQFIGTLHRSGLILSSAPGQGDQLKKRRDERSRKELLSKLTNILSIRFKGIDPHRLLTWLNPVVGWFFSRTAVFFFLMLAMGALTLVMVQFDVFRSRLPAFQQFFNIHNAMWLGVALAFSKVLHEFGHGLTCKRFGGECHEMGVMFLVLTPCLYCNVSDSWMLPNKWHRAAIGAAGMYVEIVIASLATFIWWFTEPGFLNFFSLNLMFVCSVSTIVFNGNPLLRYDGYYILSDIVEIPNLRSKASEILSRKLGYWCLGLERPEDPFLPQRNQWFFALYTVASAIYRWFVVFSILLFLYKVFEPYRLQVIGQGIALMSIYGLIGIPLWKVAKFFYIPGRIDLVKKPRMFATLALLGIVIAAILLVPLPHHVFCTFEIKPLDAKAVYVDVPGQLKFHVEPLQQVDANQPLARLTSEDLEYELVNLESQKVLYETQLLNLQDMRFVDKNASLQIAPAQESLDSINRLIQEKREDQQRLTVVSPRAGRVIPPPMKAQPPHLDEQLPEWFGSPLDDVNLGAYLEAGTLLCHIGDPSKMQAELVIDQADVEFVKVGQPLELKLEELPDDTLPGKLDRIATIQVEVGSRQLSNKTGGELATMTDEAGVERLMSTSYQARVPLDNDQGLLRPGLRGRAKIYTEPRTVAQRIWRWWTQTFNFRL
jgi:putative peptide zinc metalloprotease protein